MAEQQIVSASHSTLFDLPYGSVVLFSGRGLLKYSRPGVSNHQVVQSTEMTLGPFPHDMLCEIDAIEDSTFRVLNLNAISSDDLALVCGTVNGTRAWVVGNGTCAEMYFDGSRWQHMAGGITSATISAIVTLTQAEYDALSPPVATTLYIVNG